MYTGTDSGVLSTSFDECEPELLQEECLQHQNARMYKCHKSDLKHLDMSAAVFTAMALALTTELFPSLKAPYCFECLR